MEFDVSVLKVKSDYEVKLDSFEGPLDLLLHLIKDAKIDIKDIFISHVTEQYLNYMSQLDSIDMEKASDFIDVAATLLEIKSNSLLPKIEELMPDQEDLEREFIRKLEEYKILKEAGEKLKVIENINRFYKEPDSSVGNVKVVLTDFSLDHLIDAFSKLLFKMDLKKRDLEIPKEILKDTFSLPDKISHIMLELSSKKTIKFKQLFSQGCSKNELIVTFLALLEVLKAQFCTCIQEGLYNEIIIVKNENFAEGNFGLQQTN